MKLTCEQRIYTINALNRYWPKNQFLIENFFAHKFINYGPTQLPPRMIEIKMPDWAMEVSVKGKFLVPEFFSSKETIWQDIDWIAVCFWYLHNYAEREFEQQSQVIHSYSFQLKNWDKRIWEYAWVNRIALFIRLWVSKTENKEEIELFGSRPSAEVLITHDVDAVAKTFSIRSKQTLFLLYKSIRLLIKGQIRKSIKKLKEALFFFVSQDDYWCFEKIQKLETQYGVKSTFNFYAGKSANKQNLKEKLFDPAYNIQQDCLKEKIKMLSKSGWKIGIHQSFDAWNNKERMASEKRTLEILLNKKIIECRQHWLRFSFEETWKIQQEIGLQLDSTLGFNDRCGFRNSSALMFTPWDDEKSDAMSIRALPMVLMDSHLYDYEDLNYADRQQVIDKWINEIAKVGGQASIIWHQRVFSKDYSWIDGYEYLLKTITKKNIILSSNQ